VRVLIGDSIGEIGVTKGSGERCFSSKTLWGRQRRYMNNRGEGEEQMNREE
jgi:hypothetical protein